MSSDAYLKKFIILLFHVLLLVTPFIWTAKMSELFEFPKMLFVYAITSLIATAWIGRMVVQKRALIRKTVFDVPILTFLASQIISTLLSIDPHTSWYGYYSRFHGGLLSTIAYITLYYAYVSTMNRTYTLSIIRTTLIGAIGASLYAFPEHFGFSPSCQIIGAGWQANCWVQDVVTRVFGTFGQPNWLAAYLISLIFIPASLAISTKPDIKNNKALLIHITVFALFFAVILFTKSRSGLLGFGLGLVVFSLISAIISQWNKRVLSMLLACYILLATCYFLWGKGIVPQLDALMTNNTSSVANTATTPQVGTVLDTGGTESGSIRKIVWQGAFDIFKKHPLFGAGVETFGYSYYTQRPASHNLTSEWDFLYNKAHNEWLNHLANSGIAGLGSYILIMVYFCVICLKSLKSPVVPGLMAGYIALSVSNFFGFSTVPVALLFFLFPAFVVSIKETETLNEEEAKSESLLSTSQSIALFVVIVAGLYLTSQVVKLYRADRAYIQGKVANDDSQIQVALTKLEEAIRLLPSEATYKDEFAQAATDAALYLYEQNQATAGAKIASLAIEASNQTLAQNKVHLNFYKSRARIQANLGIYQPHLLEESANTLKQAIALSPTDAKLYFSLGMLYLQKQDFASAKDYLNLAIELKPNYELARFTLGELLMSEEMYPEAKNQFEYIITSIAPGNVKAKTKLAEIEKLMPTLP